jgi:hypothetical protein
MAAVSAYHEIAMTFRKALALVWIGWLGGGCGDDGGTDGGPTFDARPPDSARNDAEGMDGSGGDGAIDDGGGSDGMVPLDCSMPRVDPIRLGRDTIAMPRAVALSADPTGFLVAWSEVRDGRENVYVKRVPLSGADMAGDVDLSMNFGAVTKSPAVTSAGTSGLVVWYDNSSIPPGFEIYARPLNASFMPGAARVRLTMNMVRDDEPALALRGSTVLAAWVEGDARTVVTRRLGLDGMPMAAPTTIDAATGVGRISLSLLMDGYALAWVQGNDAVVLRLDDTGAAVGTPTVVSTESNVAGELDISTTDGGGAMVFGVLVAGARDEVRFRPILETGEPALVEQVITPAPERARDASIARYGGGYVVAYRAIEDTMLTAPSIRIAAVDPSGDVVNAFEIAPTTESGGRTSIAVAPDGTILLAWASIEGAQTQLYAVRVRCE